LYRTGATGYIGGDALYAIATAHPDFHITCLARDEEKGRQITKAFPDVKIIIGDLDSSAILEKESAAADIVCSKFS
jgi:N-acetyl-gamma-glutamylphosphate reductase